MRTVLPIGLAVFVPMTAVPGRTQSSGDASQSSGAPSNTGATPAAGADNSQINSPDNPPISSLDQPSLETRILDRSFLAPGLHASQSLDTNVTNDFGNTKVEGVTRLLGSLALQKLSGRSSLALDYVAGVALYSRRALGANQVQQLDFADRFQWRTGYITFRDSFSYLPEGSFGFGSYGGTGVALNSGYGIGGGGLPGGGFGGFFGGVQSGGVGQIPRIDNTSIVDVTQALSRRSALTLAGSFGVVHFTDNSQGFI